MPKHHSHCNDEPLRQDGYGLKDHFSVIVKRENVTLQLGVGGIGIVLTVYGCIRGFVRAFATTGARVDPTPLDVVACRTFPHPWILIERKYVLRR